MTKTARVLATRHNRSADGGEASFELVINYDGEEHRIRLQMPPGSETQSQDVFERQLNEAYDQFVDAIRNAEGLPLKI